jgi:hypothetical protein
MLGKLNKAIAPKWIIANTSDGGAETDNVVRQVTATYEEFGIRALAHNWEQFLDLAQTVNRRQNLTSQRPYMVLDSLPQGGSATDPRTQISTLAYYYLLANPDTTFLNLWGGDEPASTWSRHWFNAVAYNVGQPIGTFSTFATGKDPSNTRLTYNIYQRTYQNALMLYKPLSYTAGSGVGTLADNTATTHQLSGNYRVLNADGTLGPIINRISLRNGEGVVLIKA